jgi:hypothetical protein
VRPLNPCLRYLVLSNNNWKNPAYMGYMWAYANSISARRVFREIPLQEVNVLVPSLKKSIYEMMESLRKANAIMAVLRCPADAVFIDEQGRRVGLWTARRSTSSGAMALSGGEVEICQLPWKQIYPDHHGRRSRPGGSGRDQPGRLGHLTSFRDGRKAGSQISGSLEPQGKIESLKSGSGSIEPTLDTSLDLGGFGEEDSEGDVGDTDDVDTSSEEIQGEEELILESILSAVDNNPSVQLHCLDQQPR